MNNLDKKVDEREVNEIVDRLRKMMRWNGAIIGETISLKNPDKNYLIQAKEGLEKFDFTEEKGYSYKIVKIKNSNDYKLNIKFKNKTK